MPNTKVCMRVLQQNNGQIWITSYTFGILSHWYLVATKNKIPTNSVLARIFGLRHGFKDKSCPCQDFRETMIR